MQALINEVISQQISDEYDVLPCDDAQDASEQATVTDASTTL